METIISMKPLLAVLVSLLLTPVLFSSRSPNVREAWTFVAALAKFLIILSMLPTILSGAEIISTVAEVIPGVPIKFKVDALGMLFALVSSSLWIVTSAYSIGYMRGLQEHDQTRYFCFFAFALSATIGVAFSANLLTLFLFYEMLSFRRNSIRRPRLAPRHQAGPGCGGWPGPPCSGRGSPCLPGCSWPSGRHLKRAARCQPAARACPRPRQASARKKAPTISLHRKQGCSSSRCWPRKPSTARRARQRSRSRPEAAPTAFHYPLRRSAKLHYPRALLPRPGHPSAAPPGQPAATPNHHLGRAAADYHKNRTSVVELTEVTDEKAVDDAVAATLHLPTGNGRSSTGAILDYLRGKTMLLVLDNCEHLVKPCARLVQTLCRDAEGLTVLATSRIPLHIEDEHVIRLEPFATPAVNDTGQLTVVDALRFDSVQLFTDRAAQSLLQFKVNDANVTAIVRICQQLDGIPLAIEIAAA